MIVLDASAMAEALVGSDPAEELLGALADEIHAPHLIDTEVTSVLRGLELGGVITAEHARQGLDDYVAFTLFRHDFAPLRERVWALRHQFTSDDGSYVALAEALGAPLVTCDRKLAAAGHGADVLVVDRSEG